jgi:flavin-dependent dehydrogenase
VAFQQAARRGRAPVSISGAGPAGLAAAITFARVGIPAVVRELRQDVGGRFHGDYQGIENWTTRGDVLEELEAIGVEPTFDHVAVREGLFFDPSGREFALRSPDPFFYLVRRGCGPGTLDTSLKDQAVACGAEIRLGERTAAGNRAEIVSHGPRGCATVAVGYLFDTAMPDGVFGVLSDELAPKGYSYLLVHGGFGTVAACLFADFGGQKRYLDRTIEFFEKRAGLRMRNPRPFGGTGQVFPPGSACRGGVLLAGEAAGFQDALWGFGIRYALLSGHLAARALCSGHPEAYDRLWKTRFGGLLRTSFVNRFFYSRMGHPGYRWLMRTLRRAPDPRQWLCRFYAPRFWKKLLSPLAVRADGWTRP